MDFFARHGRTEPGAEPTNLAAVQADEALIESLRELPPDFDAPLFDDIVDTDFSSPPGRHRLPQATAVGSADTQLAQLLRAWQHEIESTPLPEPIDVELAVALVRNAPPKRRALRPMIAVAAAIAGLLVGSAAIGTRSATPDSLLWPVTQMLWGERADSVMASIDARKGIDQAHAAIEAGHPDAAGVAIDHVTSVITMVEEGTGKQTLQSQLEQVQKELESVTSGTQTSHTTSTLAESTSTLPTTPEAPPSTEVPPSTSEVLPSEEPSSTDVPTSDTVETTTETTETTTTETTTETTETTTTEETTTSTDTTPVDIPTDGGNVFADSIPADAGAQQPDGTTP